jgi:hypothetical protein
MGRFVGPVTPPGGFFSRISNQQSEIKNQKFFAPFRWTGTAQ